MFFFQDQMLLRENSHVVHITKHELNFIQTTHCVIRHSSFIYKQQSSKKNDLIISFLKWSYVPFLFFEVHAQTFYPWTENFRHVVHVPTY
jgi:hypothetical protein